MKFSWKILPKWPERMAKSLVEILHGIPEARARKERAEASIKETEALEKRWKFLGKAGYSKEERKYLLAKNQRTIKSDN